MMDAFGWLELAAFLFIAWFSGLSIGYLVGVSAGFAR